MTRLIFAAATAIALVGQPALAQANRATDALLDLMSLPETIEIMRAEGKAYADELAAEMLSAAPGQFWSGTIDAIYDPARMEATVREGFADSFEGEDVQIAPLERFFGSEIGQDVIRLEISAREAMSDEAIEEAAKAAYLDRAAGDAAGDADEDARLAQIEEFVAANDLIEANVVGGMNTTVRFYQGLVDGGALQMSEADILREVWQSEADTRADTTEWIFGFLLMAYRPLSDGALEQYAQIADSPEGQAMNRALFAGFDEMYGDISYALGRAVAQEMDVRDL